MVTPAEAGAGVPETGASVPEETPARRPARSGTFTAAPPVPTPLADVFARYKVR